MIQYEVAKLAVPPVPAALTLLGPTPTVGMPNSNPFNVIGTDGGTLQNGSACSPGPGTGKPAIVTATDQGSSTETPTQLASDSRNTLINAILANGRGPNYTGVDNCTGGMPDVQNGQNVTNSLLDTPLGLQGIAQNVQNAATTTAQNNPQIGNCAGPPVVANCIPDLGTDANPKVTVVDGDLTLSGLVRGAGILLVTGTLTYSGNFGFDGMVLAIGEGKIVANGGGNGQFNGAVIIANIANDSGCSTNGPCYKTNPTQANLLTDPNTGQPVLGPPTLDWSGGGGNGIQYDSCALQLAANAPAYTVIARREITY